MADTIEQLTAKLNRLKTLLAQAVDGDTSRKIAAQMEAVQKEITRRTAPGPFLQGAKPWSAPLEQAARLGAPGATVGETAAKVAPQVGEVAAKVAPVAKGILPRLAGPLGLAATAYLAKDDILNFLSGLQLPFSEGTGTGTLGEQATQLRETVGPSLRDILAQSRGPLGGLARGLTPSPLPQGPGFPDLQNQPDYLGSPLATTPGLPTPATPPPSLLEMVRAAIEKDLQEGFVNPNALALLKYLEAGQGDAGSAGAAAQVAATAESARQFDLAYPLNVAARTTDVAKQFEFNPLDRARPLAGHEEGGVLSQIAQRAGLPYSPIVVQDFMTAYDIYKNKILGGQQ